MSADKAKKEYKILLESGDLLEMFPDFTGVWQKDKKDFIRYHEMNEDILNINVDYLDDGLEEFYED